jgi:thiol-disulfide isomerase/thioredoxin
MKKICFAILVLFALSADAKTLKVGETAYDMLGTSLGGTEIKLSDYKGKIIILSFWATWCNECRKEIPALYAIQNKSNPEKLQVIAINAGEKRALVEKFLSDYPVSKIIFTLDPGITGWNYKVNAIPTIYVVDTEGKISYVKVGYKFSDVQKLVDHVNSLSGAKQ